MPVSGTGRGATSERWLLHLIFTGILHSVFKWGQPLPRNGGGVGALWGLRHWGLQHSSPYKQRHGFSITDEETQRDDMTCLRLHPPHSQSVEKQTQKPG